jgi:ABC-type sugar transport system substrate-binding protein
LGNHPFGGSYELFYGNSGSLHSNVSLKISKAENSVKKQIADIQKMINDNVDAIIISPIEPDLIVPIVKKPTGEIYRNSSG